MGRLLNYVTHPSRFVFQRVRLLTLFLLRGEYNLLSSRNEPRNHPDASRHSRSAKVALPFLQFGRSKKGPAEAEPPCHELKPNLLLISFAHADRSADFAAGRKQIGAGWCAGSAVVVDFPLEGRFRG